MVNQKFNYLFWRHKYHELLRDYRKLLREYQEYRSRELKINEPV